MRVFFITGEYPPMPSGVGDHVNHLVRSLSRCGHEIRVLTSINEFSGHEPDFDPRISVFRKVAHWDKRALPIIQEGLNEWCPEILHIQYHVLAFQRHPFVNFLPLILKRNFPRLKILTTYHEFAAPYRRLALLPLLMGSHTNIVTNDDHFARITPLMKLLFIKERLALVPMGPNVLPVGFSNGRRENLRARLGVRRDEILLVRFGIYSSITGLRKIYTEPHIQSADKRVCEQLTL